MISVIQVNDTYQIRFRYDPDLVTIMKSIPGKQWCPEIKAWTIPTARLGFLLNKVKGTVYEPQIQIHSFEKINMNAPLLGVESIPNIDVLADYRYRVQDGYHPYKHQVDSLKFAVWRYTHGLKSGFLLADQPGLGKTLQICNIALWMREHIGLKHCLIVTCVNSAKYNWKDDIEKHTNGQEDPYILGTRLITRGIRKGQENLVGGGEEKLDDLVTGLKYGSKGEDPLPFFLILNIEAFGTKRAIPGKKKKEHVITNQLIRLLNSGYIGMVALDEIHENAGMSSTQGKELLRLKKNCPEGIQWYPMTGTPITSRPTDVFLPLRLVDGHTSDNYNMWCQRFCLYGGFDGKDIVGYKNIDVLKDMLQPNMLRRLKEDVLDLPPKIYFTEYIDNSSYQRNLYLHYEADLVDHIQEIKKAMNPASKFLRLRQINGSPEIVDTALPVDNVYLSRNAKMHRVLELVDEIVKRGEKVIIFSNWVEPLRTLYHFVKLKYKVCCFTGTMDEDTRQKHKEVFIKNPNYPVMIGTVGALGTSHTLTVATNVIFYDVPWSPSQIQQCEDRCHRPGTKHSVNVYTLVVRDTIDEKVHRILSRKEGTANYIVDDELDLRNHPEIVDLLLGGNIK